MKFKVCLELQFSLTIFPGVDLWIIWLCCCYSVTKSYLMPLVDCSPPGFSVHRTYQARTLEWVAISPGDLPNSGIEPGFPALQADPYKGRRFLKKLLNKHTAII